MMLAETSLWIQYLRVGHPAFKALLAQKQISIHWIVIGELAAGNLPLRAEFLAAARLSAHPLWALDARLATVATELGAGDRAP